MTTLQVVRKNTSTDEVWESFSNYFSGLGYALIPGSSLLDKSVPMSFVMSAGMVQFERLSSQKRSGDKFVLIQNCFRYFDLEKIGNSNTHLSLFRMPGAFEFGTITTRRTISNIWSLLIDIYGLNPKTLWVTYFAGDTIDGQFLPADSETASAWREAGMQEERIIGLPAKTNFWSQTSRNVGSHVSGKRGPNTEVFYDRGTKYRCSEECIPGCGCGRFVEFLNTLFISLQYDQNKLKLIPLEEPFVEVVIGLERVAMLLQGKNSVYEIDCIDPLIQQLRCFSKPLPGEIEGLETRKFENVLVDHLRALLFLITDGAPPPGKGGRARLIRILVRELLTSQRLLGISDSGFLRSMILIALDLYPQVVPAQKLLIEYVAEERDRFEKTVQVGLYDLESLLERRKQRLEGKDVLALEKKHGLPFPLLRYRLWQKRAGFDQIAYETAREKFYTKQAISATQEKIERPLIAGFNSKDVMMAFFGYYAKQGYRQLPGSSLLDDSIPMSFVMSAGLVQVEKGSLSAPKKNDKHVALLQNCFRHFDLDKIGFSSTHLSFFRMLGAFTFDGIDRRSQIEKAWHLITQVYKLPPERLWITYFQGELISGVKFSQDIETRRAWQDVGISRHRLLGLDARTNFWKQSAALMGIAHVAKCGPNSEIFFDRGHDLACGPECRPGCSCGRFIEFLNMLFITWSFEDDLGGIKELDVPFTEIVIGVERLAMILQDRSSVYEIDDISPLLSHLFKFVKTKDLPKQEQVIYTRILVDHLRALLFLIVDGAPPPGKGGRSFIIRRLIRECLVSRKMLEIVEPGFWSSMIDLGILIYPSLQPSRGKVRTTLGRYIDEEAKRFESTLSSGIQRVERILAENPVGDWISGEDIVSFEKKFGLPFPVLARYLSSQGIAFNFKAYRAAMQLWEWDSGKKED